MDAHDIALLKTLRSKTGNELPNGMLRLSMSVMVSRIQRIYINWLIRIATGLIKVLRDNVLCGMSTCSVALNTIAATFRRYINYIAGSIVIWHDEA